LFFRFTKIFVACDASRVGIRATLFHRFLTEVNDQ